MLTPFALLAATLALLSSTDVHGALFQYNECILLDIEFTVSMKAFQNNTDLASVVRTPNNVVDVGGSCNESSNASISLIFTNDTSWEFVFSKEENGNVQMDRRIQMIPMQVFGSVVDDNELLSIDDPATKDLFNSSFSFQCRQPEVSHYHNSTAHLRKFDYEITVEITYLHIQAFNVKNGTFSPSLLCVGENDTTTSAIFSSSTTTLTTSVSTTFSSSATPISTATSTSTSTSSTTSASTATSRTSSTTSSTASSTSSTPPITPAPTASSSALSTSPAPTASSSTPSTTPAPTASSSAPSTTPAPTASSSTLSTTPAPTVSSSTPSTTPAPTPSSSTPSTTPAPTASTPNPTTSSTTPTSTSATPPTSAPTNPPTNNYTVASNDIICIALLGALKVVIRYETNATFTNSTTTVFVPANAAANGSCNSGHVTFTQYLDIFFLDGWSLRIEFGGLTTTSKLSLGYDGSYGIRNLTLTYKISQAMFPNSSLPVGSEIKVYTASAEPDFPKKTSGAQYYKCVENIRMKLTDNVTIIANNLLFKAFNLDNDAGFTGDADECSEDAEVDLVTPIVSCSILLFIILLIVLMNVIAKWRKRKQQRHYQRFE